MPLRPPPHPDRNFRLDAMGVTCDAGNWTARAGKCGTDLLLDRWGRMGDTGDMMSQSRRPGRPKKSEDELSVSRTLSWPPEIDQWIQAKQDAAEEQTGYRPTMSAVIRKILEREIRRESDRHASD